jgi:uncharacterized protein YaaR (DUF327 family)
MVIKMKVRGVVNKHENTVYGIGSSEGKKINNASNQDFGSCINEAKKGEHESRIISLAEQICSQGKIVCKQSDLKELKKYKEIISDFLQSVVEYNFELEKQSNFDSSGRLKSYSNIKKINQKIEQLTQEILKEQKDSIAILKMIDDINGLILDIIL